MTTSDETQTTPTTPEQTSFWHRKPTLLVGGGLAVVALLAGGIGIGSAMADGDDDGDDRATSSQPAVEDDTDDADDVADQTPVDSGSAEYGVTDAAALTAILSAASKESGGTPTSMEAHRNGSWSVDFEAGNGDETTVLVADGKATVVRTEPADGDDANDPAPAGKLNEASLSSAVTAALAEAKGAIIGVDLDDNPNEAYSVQILTSSNTETEIDLDTDFKVTKTDVDDD